MLMTNTVRRKPESPDTMCSLGYKKDRACLALPTATPDVHPGQR